MDKYNKNRIAFLAKLGGPFGWDDRAETMEEWLRFWLYRIDFIPALRQSAFCFINKKKLEDYKNDWDIFYSSPQKIPCIKL